MEIKLVRAAMLDNSSMDRVIEECRAYLTKARFTGGKLTYSVRMCQKR